MRKQLRQYLRRSLCGVLSAAMILTGSAIPDLAVHAAQTNVEDFTEADEQINETPSAETNENDAIDNPDAGNDAADGVENIDQNDSDQKGEEASDEQGEDCSEDDGKTLDDADSEDGDDAKNDEEATEDETGFQKASKGVMTVDDETAVEYGTLVNGDFEDSPLSSDGSYYETPTGWTLKDGLWPKKDGANDTIYLYYNYWVENPDNSTADKETSAEQEIKNLKPGVYRMSVEAGGTYADDKFALKVTDSSDNELTSKSLGKGEKWGKWETYTTDVFEVTESNNSSIKVTISGSLAANKDIHLDNVTMTEVTYTLAQLSALYDEAEKLAASDYTTDSYAGLKTAKDAAKTVIDKGGTATSGEIIDAYVALETAMDELVSLGSTVTFYYYAGDIDDEIGLYYWDKDSSKGNISSTAQQASWNVWGDNDTYLMEAVEGYAGWYEIPITFKNNGTDAGFQVYTKANKGTNNCEYKCDEAEENHPDVYKALTSGDNKTAAVKSGIAYIGTYDIGKENTEADKAAMIMRNITLYIYSEDVTPVIQLDNNSAAAKLSVVNEDDGSISDLTPSGKDSYDNPVYEMQKLEDDAYWYTLSFSVPGAIKPEKEKICGLVEKTGYSWLKDLTNGSTGTDYESDLTPVFDGKVWGKYDSSKKELTFYATKDEAVEKITLATLKALLESEEVKTISDKGQEGYTEASWTAFNTAKTAAETVVKDNSTQADSYESTAISEAYVNLKDAVKNMETVGGGDDDTITLYYYSKDLNGYTNSDTETYHLYMSTWNKDKIASSKEEVELKRDDWDPCTAYLFDEVTDEAVNKGYKNWYSVPVKRIDAGDGASGDGFIIQTGKAVVTDGTTTHTALVKDEALITLSAWENTGIYNEIVSMEKGGSIAIKDGKAFASIQEAEDGTNITKKLQILVNRAKRLKEEDYKEGWEVFAKALKAAEDVLKAAADAEEDTSKEAPTEEQVNKAYDDLEKAMDALVPARSAEINVKQVALTDDFITGADLSSYIALKDSGVVFKDEDGKPLSDQGFFNYLHDGGMNYVRIRIWNDPYTSSGNGYGGGNNDLEKAIRLGQLATKADMRVLIDFHYSDFWADPKKQKAPKAWAGYSIEQKEKAVYDFTLDSLNALRNAGVDVGMVQVGNETNNGIAGETDWKNMATLFNAGSKAVRKFDENCLVAVHFTDPQKGYSAIAKKLQDSEVDYDVFASSYYPFGHGDAANLKAVLTEVVETYGKQVMAAETSWPTTLVDGDGYGTATPPTVPEQYESQNYGVSVQGQADEMYDLIKAVNEINDEYPESSLGVFYWEPAWISPYYIKDDEGNDIDSLYKQNYDLWEKYGSGWASSYAAEYDPDDAGVWFGGSAMDNSSWFDFDGTALPTAKIYSLIRTGATAERKIASVDSNPVMKVDLGTEIKWNEVKVTAKYNDRTEEDLPVVWEESETELVNTYKAGEYIVHGIVSAEGKNYKITLTVQVLRDPANNILENPDFENNKIDPWVVDKRLGHGETETDPVVNVTKEDPHGGSLGLHFWSKIGLDFTVSQTVTPEAGTYTFGGYIQGGGADSEDVQYAFVQVKDKDGKLKSNLKTAFALNGWNNWVNPEITGITVEAGDTMEVGLIMKSTPDGAWGTMDDFYLYGTHTVSIAEDIEHGTVATNVVKADSGDKIIVTVTPESGYYPEKVILSGASITDKTLTSSNGSVTYVPAAGETTNQAVLTYTEKTAEEKSETFTMPKGNVMVSAEFVSVFEDGAEKISLDAKENGKYLVEVNAGESIDSAGETPIADQFYTNKDVKPAVQLSYKGYKLTAADYTVSYSNNKNMTTDDSKAKITLTAKGEKFTGTREILFEIKEDKRQDFNAKKLKVVFEASDKSGRTDKAAQAVYYLGTEKEIEPKISLYNAADDITDTTKAIDPSMYDVYYQNNKKIGKATLVILPSETAQGMPDGYKEGSITTTFTITKCPINQKDVTIEMSAKQSYYTGKKAEPAATVTYTYTDQNGDKKNVTLVKGRDYTVTYTNNMNASVYEVKDEQGNTTGYQDINPKKVPTVKITGKGNFTGVRTTFTVDDKGKAGTDKITFEILPRSITNTTITVADLAESTKAQAPKITVKDGGKAVAANQYVIEEIVRTHDEKNDPINSADDAYKIYSREKGTGTPKVTEAGTYQITIAGKERSNYTDISGKLTFKVVAKENLIPNAKITVNGKFYYTGEAVTLSTSSDKEGEKPNLTVTVGTGSNAKPLTGFASRSAAKDNNGVEQDGYYVTYVNNVNAGKATITINGTGNYVGTKTSTFTINKRTLAKTVSDNDKDKKGAIQTPKLSVKVAKEKLDGVWVPDEADVADDAKGALIDSDKEERGSLEIPYTGYTINPDFKFYSDNYYAGLEDQEEREDQEGQEDKKEKKDNVREIAAGDYTVSYKVGKWENGKAPVTVTVKGKGNYSGSVKFDNLFTLTARDFSKLSVEVASATYNGKALKPAVTFYNEDGKVVDLKLGTAYTATYKNNTDAVQKDNKQPTVTVKPKGNGWASTANVAKELNFTIGQAEITRADIEDVKFQTFLGKALKPKVTVKVNGRKLKEGKDYTLSYSKNVKRGGKATVTITGKGNYFTRQPIEKTFVIK